MKFSPLIFIVLLFFIAIFLKLFSKKLFPQHLNKYPYKRKKEFLSLAEIIFFNTLKNAIKNNFHVFCQVKLDQIIQVENLVKNKISFHNKIDRKSLDFVLCDNKTFKPILIIELDDRSHFKLDRIERDKFIDNALKICNIPILHIPCKNSYNIHNLAQQIADKIK